MIVTVLKTTYKKTGPTVINYRDYKNFSEQTFKRELKEELDSIEQTDLDYSSFQNCFEKVLDKHAPMKKKYARANDGPFMNRVLRKATMLRSRLKNRYNKSSLIKTFARSQIQMAPARLNCLLHSVHPRFKLPLTISLTL